MDDRTHHTYSKWREQRSPGASGGEIQESLSNDFRRAWNSGDVETKVDVLHYLAAAVPRDGADTIWSAIEADDERIASVGLHAATKYARRLGVRPDAEQAALVRRIVQGGWSDSTRMTALEVLELAGLGVSDSWLDSVAKDDPSERVRRRANIMLMRHGSRQATEALLADLREQPGHFGVADDLWDARHNVDLHPDEEQELRAVISRYVDWLQGRLRDQGEERRTRNMAASMLAKFRNDGFPLDADDAEALYELVASARKPQERIGYIDLLAAFDLPAARKRIEDIARTDEAPEVREHAKRTLE